MARLAGGIGGWVAGVAPVLAVNGLGRLGALSPERTLVAGAGALLGGCALGGIVAGALGGQPTRQHVGASGAAVSGISAAILCAVTLYACFAFGVSRAVVPSALARDPLRIALAIICLCLVQLLIALSAGSVAGRQPPAPSAPGPRSPAGVPTRQRSGAEHAPDPWRTPPRLGARPGPPPRSAPPLAGGRVSEWPRRDGGR